MSTLEERLHQHFKAEDAGLATLVPLAQQRPSDRHTAGLSLADQADLVAYDQAESVWDAARPPAPKRRFGVIAGGLLAAAAALLFFVLRPTPGPTDDSDQLRPMGASVYTLEVAVERGGQARTVKTGDTLKVGDRIGLFYTAHEPGHLHVMFVGESADVMLPSQPIKTGTRVALPSGGELTAGTGCEYIVGFFSKSAVDAAAAKEAVMQAERDVDRCTLKLPEMPGTDIQVIGIRR
jgi:hypothetical protein